MGPQASNRQDQAQQSQNPAIGQEAQTQQSSGNADKGQQQIATSDSTSSTQTVQYSGQSPVEVTTTTTPTSTGNDVSITASPAPASQPSAPFSDGSEPTQVVAGNVPNGATEVSDPAQATIVYTDPINGIKYYYSTGK